MKRRVSQCLRCLKVCLIVSVVVFQYSLSYADPLPQRILNRPLQRDDCVVREETADVAWQPYIQEFVLMDEGLGIEFYSCINWWHGFLKSEGSGKDRSRFAAELVAKSNAVKTLLVSNLNAQATLQEYVESRDAVMLSIRNVLVRKAQVQELLADSEKPDEARVIVTIPFYGISGLLSFFLDDQEIYLQKPAQASKETLQKVEAPAMDAYTGILIDARALAEIEPALFPQIVSETGELIYSASQVDREILAQQGMVRYRAEDTQELAARIGEHPLLVKPVLLASTAPGGLLLAEVNSRKGEGQGNNVVITPKEHTGQRPVNIVISVEDAEKLKQLNRQHEFDKHGKYIILIGREIAGDEGQYPESFVVMRLNL